jgi:uncharacterized membrane protein YeaQ/YmgE (transglycosylase-associated protein family)
MLFAELISDPKYLAAWIGLGLIAGWLASKMVENPSYGIIGDLLLGSIGGLLGEIVFGFTSTGLPDFWVALLVAFVGACILVVGARIVVARLNAE